MYVHADRDRVWIVVDDAGERLDSSKRAPAFDQKGGFGLFTIREIHGIRKAGDLDLGHGEYAIGCLPSVADMCQQNVIDFAKARENRAIEKAIEVKNA